MFTFGTVLFILGVLWEFLPRLGKVLYAMKRPEKLEPEIGDNEPELEAKS